MRAFFGLGSPAKPTQPAPEEQAGVLLAAAQNDLSRLRQPVPQEQCFPLLNQASRAVQQLEVLVSGGGFAEDLQLVWRR